MSWLKAELAGGRTQYRPGETVGGAASWSLDAEPKAVELRLFWRTEGKGTQDVGLIQTVPFDGAGREGRRDFELHLPEGPYSFSGRLISLLWAIAVVAEPGGHAGRAEITVSPTGKEIVLVKAEA